MKRREFLKSLLVSSISLSFPSICSAKQKTQKPNILFIFADDQSWETVHALGCNEIITPNLDKLIKNGTTFINAYNQGAWHGAVCVASRTMLNTGRFIWNAQHAETQMKRKNWHNKLWAQCLKQAGYETYFSGKWHLDFQNVEKVFDHCSNVRPGMPGDSPQGYHRPIKNIPDPWKPWKEEFGGYWQGGKHWSEVLGDDAVKYLEQASKKQDPFFMYLAFNAPHDPRQSPKEYVDKYPLDKIKVPDNFAPTYKYKDPMGCGACLRDEKLAPFPRTRYSVKTNRQEYYAIITHMDKQIGRILKALDASGKADNTYIFFTADHGLAVGHHGLMGKQNMFDHSIKVPLIVSGPTIPVNKKINQPVYLQDIMPTTLDLASVQKPPYVQFKSFLPTIKQQEAKHYDAIYSCYTNTQRMVTKGSYKLILYPKIKVKLLYNIKNDPQEMRDLSNQKKFKPIIKSLFKTLLSLQKETCDQLDLTKIYPELLTNSEAKK